MKAQFTVFASFALAGFLIFAGCAATGPAAQVSYAGGVMVNSAGMTLYTFETGDGVGKVWWVVKQPAGY